MLRFFFITILLCIINTSIAQNVKDNSYNLVDSNGKRTGFWILKEEAIKGEPSKTQFGNFIDGRKNGTWYELDFEGKPIAILKYLNGVLNGESKYFENGKLVCIGTWRGLNPDQEYDTIWVYDPIKGYDDEVVVSTEKGSLQHGIWKYFHPESGILIKEEEFQVGERIKIKEYTPHPTLTDERKKELEKQHNIHLQKKTYKPKKVQTNKL